MFAIHKDDLRFEIYKMITDIMQDNIKLRLWVNEMTGYTLRKNNKKIEDHATTQKTILEDSGLTSFNKEFTKQSITLESSSESVDDSSDDDIPFN